MNTIIVSADDGDKIFDLYSSLEPNSMYEDNFIFDEFMLIIGDVVRMKVNAKKGNRIFEISGAIGSRNKLPIYFEVIMDNLKRKCRFCPRNDSDNIFISQHREELKEHLQISSEWVFMIIYHVMNYPRNHKQTICKSSHKYKYSREHRLSTESNKIWLFDDIVNYVAEKYVPEGGHHEIMCPCWEVRGHYRHLKSGKVIFIRPFKKGKERTTAEPKTHEYYLDKSMQ